jgi:hypothetical protein
MLRMIMVQAAFGMLGKMGKLKQRSKFVFMLFLSFCFIFYDMQSFLNKRKLNVYEQIGVQRDATDIQIENVLNMY